MLFTGEQQAQSSAAAQCHGELQPLALRESLRANACGPAGTHPSPQHASHQHASPCLQSPPLSTFMYAAGLQMTAIQLCDMPGEPCRPAACRLQLSHVMPPAPLQQRLLAFSFWLATPGWCVSP